MTFTYICLRYLARRGAPVGGRLVSQEIGGCMVCRRLDVMFVFRTERGGAGRDNNGR